MDRSEKTSSTRITRRFILKLGAGIGATAIGIAAVWHKSKEVAQGSLSLFKNEAPRGKLWEKWQQRGWFKEAKHYLKLGQNVQCKLCPNNCLLETDDRSKCRVRVNKDGKLYTLAYANPCAFNLDPVEKKPLYHFMPQTATLSIATAGCTLRCLNCQNWDISQSYPEETKDLLNSPLSLSELSPELAHRQIMRLSATPKELAEYCVKYGFPSVSYTYSEPSAWYEYMQDCAQELHEKNLKNIWVTCGNINPEPLKELAPLIDAANVDIKAMDDKIYQKLNSGKLKTVQQSLEILKKNGVWVEITYLMVPNFTDNPESAGKMAKWLKENLGADVPLHLSRFQPAYKLANLPPTPPQILRDAFAAAKAEGLHYIYIGNAPEFSDGGFTICPNCQTIAVRREGFITQEVKLADTGECLNCGYKIAGKWTG